MLVGILGYAGSGKDEVGKVLVDELGFNRVAFADKVRAMARGIDPYVRVNRKWWFPKFVRLSTIIPDEDTSAAWAEVKQIPDVRRLLQRLGTEGGREVLYDDVWVDAALNGLNEDHDWIITDVRFPNEFDAIRSRGGMLVRVRRPDTGPLNDHASETSMDDVIPELTIHNNGTIEELRYVVRMHDFTMHDFTNGEAT